MPTRLRKIRRKRGSRTCGWGRQSQHRRHSRKGGRGKAGIHKHKWVPPAPKHEGKRGFRSIWAREVRTINVGELDELIAGMLAEGKLVEREGIVEVDLTELGYEKVLGRGNVSRPIIVKAKAFSERAIARIEVVGGKAIVVD